MFPSCCKHQLQCCRGGNIFPAFVALIKSTKDEEKKAAALANVSTSAACHAIHLRQCKQHVWHAASLTFSKVALAFLHGNTFAAGQPCQDDVAAYLQLATGLLRPAMCRHWRS